MTIAFTAEEDAPDAAIMDGLLEYCFETGREALLAHLRTPEGLAKAHDVLLCVQVDEYDSFEEMYEEVCALIEQQ